MRDEKTFWVALAHEAIVALGEDYPEAAQVIAAQVVIFPIDSGMEALSKEDVRARYVRLRDSVKAHQDRTK